MTIVGIMRTERRAHARIAALAAARPNDRRELIWARSVDDLRRMREQDVDLTAEEQRAADEHLERVAAEFGLAENELRAQWGDR